VEEEDHGAMCIDGRDETGMVTNEPPVVVCVDTTNAAESVTKFLSTAKWNSMIHDIRSGEITLESSISTATTIGPISTAANQA
jgi:hypothetical protein